MKRIAFASPLNPAPSGISDYSEELLPYLGQYFDLTLYTDDGLKPTNQELLRLLDVRPLSRLARDQRQHPYDAILYQIGNSPVHASIWTALQHTPGIVVLHEFVLNHFMLNYAAVVQRDIAAYAAEATRRYDHDGQRVAQLMIRGRLSEAAFHYPFSETLIEAADGVIAHSQYVIDRVAAVRADVPLALVPMGIPLPHLIGRDTARARRGLAADTPILASFGHINPYKRIEAVLQALRVLREQHRALHYILVGSVSPNFNLRALIERYGVQDIVTVTGYVDRAVFEDYVAAADICLNLRHPTAGETSASLLRLLGAGRPTLVTASGAFSELPQAVAAQVDPDASEGDLIIAYCELLLTRPELARALGAHARAFVAQAHTLERAAEGYAQFLAARYGWAKIAPLRPPLWSLEPAASSQQPAANENGRTERQPVASDPGRAASPLVAASAAALAELGATEDDMPLLRGAAGTIREIAG